MNEQIKAQLAPYMKENGFYDTLRIRTELEGKEAKHASFDDIFGDDLDSTPEVKSELLIAAEKYNAALVASSSEQTFTVSMNDNTVDYDGVTFIVNVDSAVNLEVSGGYAPDDDGDFYEVDGNYHIRTLIEDAAFIEYSSQEFEITITADDVRKAKAYRAMYVEDIGAEF